MVALHPDFDVLLPTQFVVDRIATGFTFLEGPVWRQDEQCLLFTDIPANRILRFLSKSQGQWYRSFFGQNISSHRYPSGHANGQTLDLRGGLICCEHSHRRVTLTDTSGRLTVLADTHKGMPLNSPNDVVMSSAGHLYFTDPAYGISPELQKQAYQGVYRLDAGSNVLTCEVDDIIGPNGLAFSPDERRLYVVDSSDESCILMFDVDSSGYLSGRGVFARCESSSGHRPDGLKVDSLGNVYCAAGGGVWVFSSSGVHLGVITLPEKPSNCAWGGANLDYLYITAKTSLYRVKVNAHGIGIHYHPKTPQIRVRLS